MCTACLPNSTCLTLLEMMALLPDGSGINFLQSLMENDGISRYVVYINNISPYINHLFHAYRSLIIKSLIAVMNKIISMLPDKQEFTIHLLNALPLLHFLRGNCSPHEQRVVQPSEIGWFDHDINLGTVRSSVMLGKGSVNSHIIVYIIMCI